MTQTFRLGRRAQQRHGDLIIGIVRTSADPDDPYARLNLVDRGSSTGDIRDVRVGDEVRIGRHVLVFTEIVPGTRDGYVVFTLEQTGGSDESAE